MLKKLLPFHSFFLVCVFVGSRVLFAQAPSGLTVTAATRQRVDLSWTGPSASYKVQRRVLGGAAYTDIATVNALTASDSTIDAYTTYQYQVVAASGSATASNPVTVGPPPAGFTVVAPAPGPQGSRASDYGWDLAMTLDGNGDPAVAFLFQDPNGDSVFNDGELWFRSWSRAKYQWNSLVRVSAVGDSAGARATVSLAYDNSTSVFAIASEANNGTAIDVFQSTNGGVTWTSPAFFNTAGASSYGPSLALANGNIYLAYEVDATGIVYVTGKLNSDSSTWTKTVAPKLSGTDVADSAEAPSLALDGRGTPGIAYWAQDLNNSENSVLIFWRPGSNPARVTDSQNNSGDFFTKLKFFGQNPRIAMYAYRNDSAANDAGVHFVRSDDGGATWTTVMQIPPDHGSSTDYPLDLALDSQGRGAIAFEQNSSDGSFTCGFPKLARSNDLTSWSTCAASTYAETSGFTHVPNGLALLYGGNDKLYLAWADDESNPTGKGVLLWREPPAGAATGPSLDAGTVENGATYQPGLVPGSWAQVRGANLATVTRIWGDADFNNGNNLPTSLSGVQVKVNNLPAAVYYISPTQVNFQVPAGISGTANVQVIVNGVPSNTVTGAAAANAPGLFGYAAGSKTYPAAVFANTSTVVGDPAVSGGAVRKAASGDRIQLYATGLAASPAGVIVTSVAGLSGVTATVGSASATVEFAGLVAVGEYQINIVMPNLPDGEYPVVIQYAGQSSQAGVIVPVGH